MDDRDRKVFADMLSQQAEEVGVSSINICMKTTNLKNRYMVEHEDNQPQEKPNKTENYTDLFTL